MQSIRRAAQSAVPSVKNVANTFVREAAVTSEGYVVCNCWVNLRWGVDGSLLAVVRDVNDCGDGFVFVAYTIYQNFPRVLMITIFWRVGCIQFGMRQAP